jgi:hypothetical protein
MIEVALEGTMPYNAMEIRSDLHAVMWEGCRQCSGHGGMQSREFARSR